MSDLQKPASSTESLQRLKLSAQRQQAQQRQILEMMGIRQWVRPQSPTIKISDIGDSEAQVQALVALDEQQPAINEQVAQHNSQVGSQSNIVSINAPATNNEDAIITESIKNNHLVSDSFNGDNSNTVETGNDSEASDSHLATTNKSYNFNDLNSFIESETTVVANKTDDSSSLVSTSVDSNPADLINLDKVAPFDLQGGRYGEWVLIVDIQALNNDSQKLWQNITQALSLECETSSFPICEGMDTAELANASLAGYIFKLGQSEDIKIAVLTALPEGLTHPNFTEVPSLETMLIDSTRKRHLWQQLSS